MSASVVSVDPYNEDSASPLTVNKPTLASVNDVLIAVIVQHAPAGHLSDMTAPDGTWIEKGNYDGTNSQGKIFSHIVAGGDPSTWSFPYYVNADTCLLLFDITGADTTPVVGVQSTTTTSLTSSYDSPTITPAGTDDLLIVAISDISNGVTFTVTIPSGTTTAGSTQIAGGFMALAGATQQLASSSATGAKTWTSVTPASTDGGSFSVTVKSGAGAATQPAAGFVQQLPNWLILELVKARQATFGPTGIADQFVTPVGIVSTEVVGTPAVTATATVNQNGIISAEKLGSPAVTSTYTVNVSGIVSTELLGAPATSPVISGNGVTSTEQFGSATISANNTINTSGIVSTETLGNANTQSASSVTPSGITSTEAVGSPTITATVTINANGIVSSEAVGNSALGRTVQVSGITSNEAVGTPTFTFFSGINPSGIQSSEQVGSPTITSSVTIQPKGIISTELFGSPAVSSTNQIFTAGIGSGELAGAALASAGSVTISANGIISGEQLGNARTIIGLVTQNIIANGITGAESFGPMFIGREMPIHVAGYLNNGLVIAKVDPVVPAYAQSIDVDAIVSP